MEPLTGVTECDAAQALLRLESDLHRVLLQRPKSPEDRQGWSETITTLLLEIARGRIYLRRLQSQTARWEDLVEACERELAS